MTDRRLSSFRAHKDDYFAEGEHSPLPPEDVERFEALSYFDERPDLAFVLPIDTTGPGAGQRIDIPTTDGGAAPFLRAGRVSFPADQEDVTFAVYKDLSRGRFFLPFKDGTNGTESYEGGRYLDPRQRPDGRLVVDFNYAYNPYCAYADGWSCPIPPDENVTTARIEAGERSYLPPTRGVSE